MKILVATDLWPRPAHSIRAAPVVFFSLITGLIEAGAEVTLLKVRRHGEAEPDTEEIEGLEQLRSKGVSILTPLDLPKAPGRRKGLPWLLNPKLSDFFPEVVFRDRFNRAVAEVAPDVLFIPWSSWLTMLAVDAPCSKFIYYGNPDAYAWRAQAVLARRFGASLKSYLLQLHLANRLEKLHVPEMAKCDMLGEVGANEATFWQDRGHPNAFYIRNTWLDRFGPDWLSAREQAESNDTCIINGNIGKLFATGNTYGLEVLGKSVAPELRQRMNGHSYEIRLVGSGELVPGIAHLLAEDEFRNLGFVEDIDDELLSSHVFLCLNNAGSFKSCHTRYLHAWSLGSCVVAHSDVLMSMPEFEHNRNALLADSPDEIAELVAEASQDKALRRRIGQAGYETFREFFTPEKVASTIVAKMQERL
jgi:hypothetical protein